MSDILAADLIKALWDDSRRETDPERKAQLERDAAMLEDVWRRSGYALAATRDQMTAALGNASLNIADTLTALASGQRRVDTRVGEIHEYVQQNNTLFSQFFDMFPPQFEAFQAEARAAWEESGRRLKKHEDDIEALSIRVDTFEDIRIWRAAVDVRLADIEQADRDDIHREITDIKAALAQYEIKHQELIARLEKRTDAAAERADRDEHIDAV